MWPSEYAELKRIEDLLICGICYEYMDTSVVTSCSHNYCSLCIRKYLHYKTQCPACFSETFEKDLRKNKVLDEIILHFSCLRKKLQECLQGQIGINKGEQSDGCDTLKSSDRNQIKSPLDKPKDKSNGSPTTPKTIQKDFSSPSTSGQSNIAQFFTPKSKKVVETATGNVKAVECPVCKVSISETNINKHLDDCLKRQEKQQQEKFEEQKRKPLPKLVFSLMKDSVIRKKLKELGLSTQGDRKTLESRLQKYIILYNAECDKLRPRPIPELIRQVEEEENIEKKTGKASSSATKFQVNRNTEENVIEGERKKYLESHKNSFDNLIAKIKKTDTAKKLPVRRSLLDDSIRSNTDVPHKRQATNQNLGDTDSSDTNDFQPIYYDDVNFQESDSNISCPLQLYSSTDPSRVNNMQSSSPCKSSTREKDLEDVPDRFFRRSEEDVPSTVKYDTDENERSTYMTSDTEASNHERTDTCPSPTIRTSVKKRVLVSQMNEIKRAEFVTTPKTIFGTDNIVKAEVTEEIKEERVQIPEDFMCDLSSNDSMIVNNTSNYAKRTCTLDSFFKNNGNPFCSPEKENISTSPNRNESRSIRKRSRDFLEDSAVKSSPKSVTGTKSQKSPVSNSVNNGPTRKVVRKKRKQASPETIDKNITAIRKSSRTRFKNSALLK